MAILRNILMVALAATALTGCYEDFNPDVSAVPVLTLNSLVTAGRPIEVEVTHTWTYGEGWADDIDINVDDAVLTVYANGSPVDGAYVAGEGDRIRIVAVSKKYGTAEAEVEVPYAVHDASTEYSAKLVSDWHSNENWDMNSDVRFYVDINLKFSDSPLTADCYKFSYKSFVGKDGDGGGSLADSPVDFNPGILDAKFEPIFSEHIGVFESIMGGEPTGFTFFTDRQFADKEYTLKLRFNDASCNVRNPDYDENLLDCGYELELQTVSQSYYSWENYKWQMENGVTGDIIDFGFGDPVWGYSNVSTGAGVVAARAISTFRVDMKDFLQSVIPPCPR